jgi:predicted DsbA family dithiol-disulfide isomerase
MKMQRSINGWIFAGCAAIALIALFVILRGNQTVRMELEDRRYPEGFRELAANGQSSSLDPILGPRQPRTDSAQPKPTTRMLCDALFRDPVSPRSGNGSLPVVAFLDYRCPFCRTLAGMLPDLQRKHGIHIIYKEWAILGPGSVLAARAALAADRQGKYADFHARVMRSRLIPTEAYLEEIASDLGMDREKLRSDMNAPAVTQELHRTAALASTLGLSGTPVLLVGRTFVTGAVTQALLEDLIRIELMESRPPC